MAEEVAEATGQVQIEQFPTLKGVVAVDEDGNADVQPVGEVATQQTDPPDEGVVVNFATGPKKYKNVDEVVEKYSKASQHLSEREAELASERAEKARLAAELEQLRVSAQPKQAPAGDPFEQQLAKKYENLVVAYVDQYGLSDEQAAAAAQLEVSRERREHQMALDVQALKARVEEREAQAAQQEAFQSEVRRFQEESPDFDPTQGECGAICKRIYDENNGQISLNGIYRQWRLEQRIAELTGRKAETSSDALKSRMAPTTAGRGGAEADGGTRIPKEVEESLFPHMSDGAIALFKKNYAKRFGKGGN